MNNVNKLKIAVLSVAIFGMFSGVTNAATTTGQSSVELVRGLSIIPAEDDANGNGSDLYFGQVLVPTQGTATVRVGPKGGTSADGTEILKKGHPATFQITGAPGKSVRIQLDDASTMSNADGSQSLAVSSFKKSAVPELDAEGTATFTVGATVTIPQDAPIGEYTGTFGVTVNY